MFFINFFVKLFRFIGCFFGFDFQETLVVQPTEFHVDASTLQPIKEKDSNLLKEDFSFNNLTSFTSHPLFLIGMSALTLYLCKGLLLKFIIKPAATFVFTNAFEIFPDFKAFVGNLIAFPTPVTTRIIKDVHMYPNVNLYSEYIAKGFILNENVQWSTIRSRLVLRRGMVHHILSDSFYRYHPEEGLMNTGSEIDSI